MLSFTSYYLYVSLYIHECNEKFEIKICLNQEKNMIYNILNFDYLPIFFSHEYEWENGCKMLIAFINHKSHYKHRKKFKVSWGGGGAWCMLVRFGACWCGLVHTGAVWCMLVRFDACCCGLMHAGAVW